MAVTTLENNLSVRQLRSALSLILHVVLQQQLVSRKLFAHVLVAILICLLRSARALEMPKFCVGLLLVGGDYAYLFSATTLQR